MQGATAVERLTIYLLIGWFVRMLREESEISAWHGLMWLRRTILLIMVGYLKCSTYTDSPYGLLRWWRGLLIAGTLELLPKRPKAKRSLPQYVLRKDCRKGMRCVLCCSYCAWIQSHGRYGRLRDTGYLSLYSIKITHLLYIDDMKLFAASEIKLKRVMTVAKNGMESTGLKWNEKKCAVIHVKRGQVEQGSGDMKVADLKPIKCLDQHNTYKFLGVFENTKQEDKQVLEAAGKTYLQRLSIIWSSPLSDHAKVVASNQYALPVLTYLMWTQTWPIANIQQLDREGGKIIVENGGNHPKGSTAILYMSRKLGGRGLKSVENEYKNTKIKAAVKLYCNADPMMAAVRSFEELAVQKGRHSIIKDAKKYAEELDLQLWLNFPNPVAVANGKEVEAKKLASRRHNQRYLRRDGKESLSRTDGTTRKLNWRNALRGFLHGRMPQRIPSLEYKSFTNSCYLPRFTTTEKQNHKSLMKNAAYAGTPWRMCSTFYLAVVHWHRPSTNRGITMLSRSYSLKSSDL